MCTISMLTMKNCAAVVFFSSQVKSCIYTLAYLSTAEQNYLLLISPTTEAAG